MMPSLKKTKKITTEPKPSNTKEDFFVHLNEFSIKYSHNTKVKRNGTNSVTVELFFKAKTIITPNI